MSGAQSATTAGGELRAARSRAASPRARRGRARTPPTWHSTPMPPSQTRWMSRYSGGRLSLSPTDHVGRRGSLMWATSSRSHCRLNWNVSSRAGARNGSRYASSESGSISISSLMNPASRSPATTPSPSPRSAAFSSTGHLGRHAVGQLLDRAEVEHPEPAVRHEQEVARVRVGVEQAGQVRPGQEQLGVVAGGGVPLLLRARGDDGRHGDAVEPLADDDLLAAGQHLRDREHLVAVEGLGEASAARSASRRVVELLGHPRAQLGEDRADVEAGDPRRPEPAGPGHLVQVGDERLARARVLDLDRDRPPVVPDGPVDLPDGRRRGRPVVEVGEAGAPLRAELLREHLVHRARPASAGRRSAAW